MRVPTALAVLLVGLAMVASPAAQAEPQDPLAIWRDVENLERHLEAACDAVEAACGEQFVERPGVVVSTQEEVEAVIHSREGGDRGLLERVPDEARRFIAYYDPIGKQVHLLPNGLKHIADALKKPELLGEDVLRTILVHEATHALDFQVFPVRWILACCARSDERLAIEAVLEGHAQLVTEEVTSRWKIPGAFRRLTDLYTGGSDQDATFTYIQGHVFMKTLLQRSGRKGMQAALVDPPCETRVIERPELFLDPAARAREPDLQAILEVFRPLVDRRDWSVSKWRLLGEPQDSLKGFVDNHGLYASSPDGNRYFNVFIVSWPSVAQAQRFAEELRQVDGLRDKDPSWRPASRTKGAGLGGALAGFTSVRTDRTTNRSPLTLHVAREGRHVIELTAFGISFREKEAQARTLDLAARLLRAPPATAAAVHLRHQVKAFLKARAEGNDVRASRLLRGLLPTQADLRRVVSPPFAEAFASSYDGFRLELRTTPVPSEVVKATFERTGPDAHVLAWAATTEELASGKGRGVGFPKAMRTFAKDVAAPGTVWVLLEMGGRGGGKATNHVAFARLGDRFLWIRDPWTVQLETAPE